MNPGNSLDRLGDTWNRLNRMWKEERLRGSSPTEAEPSLRKAFTIALSRESGAKGTTVGLEVGARLGWPVYDQELLNQIAQEMGLRSSALEGVDEQWVPGLEEALESFLALTPVSQSAYVQHLVRSIMALAKCGECVIVGRGAAHILPPETTLRVRIIGHLKDRVAHLGQIRGISQKEAARQVESIDQTRNRFIKQYFVKDPADPQNYDLVLNSSHFTTGECADIIVAALRCRQTRAAGKAGATPAGYSPKG